MLTVVAVSRLDSLSPTSLFYLEILWFPKNVRNSQQYLDHESGLNINLWRMLAVKFHSWQLYAKSYIHLLILLVFHYICYNKSALHIASNSIFPIEPNIYKLVVTWFDRNCSMANCDTPCSTFEQPANLFTKALPNYQLTYLFSKLEVCNYFTTPNLRGC